MAKLFGTDGIRGVADEYPVTPEIASKVGQAVAFLLREKGLSHSIVIGRDTRLSGESLQNAAVSGILSTGAEVLLAGILPTPAIAFLAKKMKAGAGIAISASHNPFQDNGIKIFSNKGMKLDIAAEKEIEGLVLADTPPCGPAPLPGDVSHLKDAARRYVTFAKKTLHDNVTLDGLRIVVDCAHGAAYEVAPAVLSELGADVTALSTEPDGRNINADCGSEYPEHLAKQVVAHSAHVGFALDGDADRVVAVDEKGNVLSGDQILAICAKVLKDKNALKNDLLVTTVMSNAGLDLFLSNLGIRREITPVGDRYVAERMKALGAVLGGEESGHFIFSHHQRTGDGIVSALQVLGAMKTEQKPLSELAAVMKKFPHVLINVNVGSKPELADIPEISDAIKKVEKELGSAGRVLVRYSGTQPMCRALVEAPTEEQAQRYCRELADIIGQHLA